MNENNILKAYPKSIVEYKDDVYYINVNVDKLLTTKIDVNKQKTAAKIIVNTNTGVEYLSVFYIEKNEMKQSKEVMKRKLEYYINSSLETYRKILLSYKIQTIQKENNELLEEMRLDENINTSYSEINNFVDNLHYGLLQKFKISSKI